jgi:hypothetical protein
MFLYPLKLPYPRKVTGWTIGVLGFDSRQGTGIFLFTTASRTALGSTQPSIQWVPGALSLGAKRPGREADHPRLSSAEVKEWVELYLHSPNTPSWLGSQLKEKHRDKFTFDLTLERFPTEIILLSLSFCCCCYCGSYLYQGIWSYFLFLIFLF